MSFNIALAFLPHTDLAATGSTLGEQLDFSEATSGLSEGPSAAQYGEHAIIVDPTAMLLQAPPANATIIGLFGTSDTYFLQRTTSQARLLVISEGEIVEDEGEALAAETLLESEDSTEDGFLAIFERVSGAGWEQLEALEWRRI